MEDDSFVSPKQSNSIPEMCLILFVGQGFFVEVAPSQVVPRVFFIIVHSNIAITIALQKFKKENKTTKDAVRGKQMRPMPMFWSRQLWGNLNSPCRARLAAASEQVPATSFGF